jgi:hypothetical protein
MLFKTQHIVYDGMYSDKPESNMFFCPWGEISENSFLPEGRLNL